MIDLKLHLITDRATRESLRAIQAFLDEQGFLRGKWQFVEFSFDKPTESFRYNHGLGFVPKDFVQTSFTGLGTILINWNNTNREYLDLTATGPCVVRGFVGAYA